MRKLLMLGTIALLAACSASPPPAAPDQSAPPAAQATPAPPAPAPAPAPMPPQDNNTPPADQATPAFADKVWRVEQSSAVEPGTTYTFVSGGTLVIDAPHGTPMTGSWSYVDDKLTMTEEGIAYPTDIVTLDAGHFTIRSHNPGGTVEIAMVAAPEVPLPLATK